MQFLYVFSLMFLSIFGLAVLIKTAAHALFGGFRERSGELPPKTEDEDDKG